MAYLERTKLVDGSNNVINPVPVEAITQGELIETLQALRMAIHALTRTVGSAYPDTAGSLRVAPTSGTITTVSTVTSMNQLNGINSQELIKIGYTTAADQIRRNITVT